MPNNPTPACPWITSRAGSGTKSRGETAYTAWWSALTGATQDGAPLAAGWDTCRQPAQRAWEAAALAVLVLRDGPKPPPRPPVCRWCGQPRAAHPQEGAPWIVGQSLSRT